jgi:hypothetical protein
VGERSKAEEVAEKVRLGAGSFEKHFPGAKGHIDFASCMPGVKSRAISEASFSPGSDALVRVGAMASGRVAAGFCVRAKTPEKSGTVGLVVEEWAASAWAAASSSVGISVMGARSPRWGWWVTDST